MLQDCQKTKRWEIERHIQRLATNYLKEHPKLRSSQEVVIVSALGIDWKDKINENEINNIENEKRDYEVLFIKHSVLNDRIIWAVGVFTLWLVGLYFYWIHLWTKFRRQNKTPLFFADWSKEEKKKFWKTIGEKFLLKLLLPSILLFILTILFIKSL